MTCEHLHKDAPENAVCEECYAQLKKDVDPLKLLDIVVSKDLAELKINDRCKSCKTSLHLYCPHEVELLRKETLRHVVAIIEEELIERNNKRNEETNNLRDGYEEGYNSATYDFDKWLSQVKKELTALADSPQFTLDESQAPKRGSTLAESIPEKLGDVSGSVDTRKGLCKCGHKHLEYQKGKYRTYCTEGSNCNCEGFEGADA